MCDMDTKITINSLITLCNNQENGYYIVMSRYSGGKLSMRFGNVKPTNEKIVEKVNEKYKTFSTWNIQDWCR